MLMLGFKELMHDRLLGHSSSFKFQLSDLIPKTGARHGKMHKFNFSQPVMIGSKPVMKFPDFQNSKPSNLHTTKPKQNTFDHHPMISPR